MLDAFACTRMQAAYTGLCGAWRITSQTARYHRTGYRIFWERVAVHRGARISVDLQMHALLPTASQWRANASAPRHQIFVLGLKGLSGSL